MTHIVNTCAITKSTAFFPLQFLSNMIFNLQIYIKFHGFVTKKEKKFPCIGNMILCLSTDRFELLFK